MRRYTLKSDTIEVGISRLGAAITSLRVKKNGEQREVCMTFANERKRIESGTYCGAVVGRVANRIAGARFTLDEKTYSLSANDGANSLHGGEKGFDRRLFRRKNHDRNTLELRLVSPDGDQGFPGEVTLDVTYRVDGNALVVEFAYTSDRDTPCAPTIHPYFRFGDKALDAELKIGAHHYLPIDEQGIPTGEIAPVEGTPMDFTSFKPISRDIDCNHPQLHLAGGYDHNFLLDDSVAATVRAGDITMTVKTDFPGMQLYSGNYIRRTDACPYDRRDGFALEPQYFPNAVNNPDFPSPVIKAGETRYHYIRFIFD